MAISDILVSFPIALTTLPMPHDVVYPFAGLSVGTTGTCEAQGLSILMGGTLIFFMNFTLSIYYVCTLVLHVEAKVFREYIEPVLYILAIASSIVGNVFLTLKEDMINPTVNDPFCGPREYPIHCKKETDASCRGQPGQYKILNSIFLIVSGASFFVLVLSMGAIIYTYLAKERRLYLFDSAQGSDVSNRTGELEHAKRVTRILYKQAIMYIVAYLITWTMAILGGLDIVGESFQRQRWTQVLRMTFQPLQGFFNMLIFFYHKIHVLKRMDKDITLADALRIIFVRPRTCPNFIAISNIDDLYYDQVVASQLRPRSRDQGSLSESFGRFDTPVDSDINVSYAPHHAWTAAGDSTQMHHVTSSDHYVPREEYASSSPSAMDDLSDRGEVDDSSIHI